MKFLFYLIEIVKKQAKFYWVELKKLSKIDPDVIT